MNFLTRIFLCFYIFTSLSISFAADLSLESQLLSKSSLSIEESDESEPIKSKLQRFAYATYRQRYLLLASLALFAFNELPMANAFASSSTSYVGINCHTMKPTMSLCEYGYFESARLRDICEYGCNSSESLSDLAHGMLNLCCDYYGYFFDSY